MNVPAGVISTESSDWRMQDNKVVPTADWKLHPIEPVSATIDFNIYFKSLVKEWKQDTSHLSLISQRVAHPAYKRIINMGRPVLPLILAELSQEPDHWFHALSFLSHENPVPQGFCGTVTEAAELWVDWGHENNLIPDATERTVRYIP